MLVGKRGAVRVEHSVDEHQLSSRLLTEWRRACPVVRQLPIEFPVVAGQRRKRGVLPLLEPGGGPAQGVEALRCLRTDAADALRLAIDVFRLDGGEGDFAIENAAHLPAATSSSIPSLPFS